MTNTEKIATLEYRRDNLLKRGFYNHKIAAKLQRKIYKLQKENGENEK